MLIFFLPNFPIFYFKRSIRCTRPRIFWGSCIMGISSHSNFYLRILGLWCTIICPRAHILSSSILFSPFQKYFHIFQFNIFLRLHQKSTFRLACIGHFGQHHLPKTCFFRKSLALKILTTEPKACNCASGIISMKSSALWTGTTTDEFKGLDWVGFVKFYGTPKINIIFSITGLGHIAKRIAGW